MNVMTAKHRSILSIVLALLLSLVMNVASVSAAKVKAPTTYTPDQLEQIQNYAADLQAMRDRLPELANLIQKQDWIFTRNFIHGPLGELRIKMLNTARNLLPSAQKNAQKLAKSVFDDLVAIDKAAQNQDYQAAVRNYAEAVRDLDSFFTILPKS